MLLPNATAQKAAAHNMISQIDSHLQIASDCRQACCHFDVLGYQNETACLLGLSLPPMLNNAVPKRKAEFIAGRYCARAALDQLDCNFVVTARDPTNSMTIGIGLNREPVWPPGFVGSITHTHGYASAVVARREHVRAVGIDSEAWIKPGSADKVARLILTDREIYSENSYLFESSLHYLTMVFSAKESLFKCLFPLINKFFDFHAAVIIPLPTESTTVGKFRFELLEDLNAEFHAGYAGQGSYSIRADMVHTAVILKAPR